MVIQIIIKTPKFTRQMFSINKTASFISIFDPTSNITDLNAKNERKYKYSRWTYHSDREYPHLTKTQAAKKLSFCQERYAKAYKLQNFCGFLELPGYGSSFKIEHTSINLAKHNFRNGVDKEIYFEIPESDYGKTHYINFYLIEKGRHDIYHNILNQKKEFFQLVNHEIIIDNTPPWFAILFSGNKKPCPSQC